MIIDNKYNIIFRRGDSDSIVVRSLGGLLVAGEKVELTVRPFVDGDVVIHKEVTEFVGNEAVIKFRPEDTEKLEFGKYVYDIQLTGAVDTALHIIPPSPDLPLPSFTLTKEVTYHG